MFFDNAFPDAIAKGLILSALGLFWIILLVRVVGLRSFSKMTNFDFVVTVAMGSLLAGASQSEKWVELVQTVTAMMALFGIQYLTAWLRQRSGSFDRFVQNQPVLLMSDGVVLHDALRATRVSKDDLMAKLREANAIDIAGVRAVVLETTGDISVLHGQDLDRDLLKGITRVE